MPVLGNRKLRFMGMVGGVMAVLHLKERWDDYKQVSTDEESDLVGSGGVALPRSPVYRDDREIDEITLHGAGLDTEITSARMKRKRRGCCVCCGLNCGLFWKAFGIVVGVLVLWNTFKFIKWVITPGPTGLEDMPEYSTSLGCLSSSHYNSTKTTYSVPLNHTLGHELEIRGVAVGTVVIAQGAADATQVKYEVTLGSDNPSMVQFIDALYTKLPEGSTTTDDSIFDLFTTGPAEKELTSCKRFDITVYLPPNLRQLDIRAFSVSHIKFDPESSIELDTLTLNMHPSDARNMLLPHKNLRAMRMSLEASRGWIVGDVSVGERTNINTERGDATANLHVFPTHSTSADSLSTAHLNTLTGSGRTDIFYINDKSFPHRLIDSSHVSSREGDIYLTYTDAEYNGYIEFVSKSFSGRGVENVARMPDAKDARPWFGNKDGGDKLSIKSPSGWVGLYFF